MLVHPWAGLPSRQALYIGLEETTGWDLLIVTARRWKDDYGRMVDAKRLRPSGASSWPCRSG